MTLPEPVIVPINRKRARVLGGFLVAVVTLCLVIAITVIWASSDSFALTGLALFCGVLLGSIGLGLITMSIRNPVALRLDRHGISGYYAEPARWQDIGKIDVSANAKGHRYLGFELNDPLLFFAQQSPWRRFVTWSNGRSSGYHIVVPDTILRDIDIEELGATAQALHAAAQTDAPPHADVS